MVFLKSLFPNRYNRFLVFTACILPISIWSWLLLLNQMPSYLMNLSFPDIMGIVAYTQTFALLESLILWGSLVLLVILLPTTWMHAHWVAQSTVLVAILSIWAAGVHLMLRAYQRSELPTWNSSLFLFWTSACLALLLAFSLVLRWRPQFEHFIISVIDRATVLASVFIAVDLLSLAYVIVHNLLLAQE